MNIRAVQKLLGHADLRMTERYSHMAEQVLAAAVQVLPALPLGTGNGNGRGQAATMTRVQPGSLSAYRTAGRSEGPPDYASEGRPVCATAEGQGERP